MAFVSGFCFARVDADELGAIAFGGLGVAPKVQIAAYRVAAPNDDEFGLCKKLDLHADLATQGVGQALATGHGANRAMQPGGPQLVEKPPRHRLALHQAHGAGVAVGNNGLRVVGGNGRQTRCNISQSRIPAHRLKAPQAFRTDPFERP